MENKDQYIASTESTIELGEMSTLPSQLPKPWLSNPYIAAATSDNTRKAYQSDVRHFESWGGILPATVEMIAQYLEAHANNLNPRTLTRKLVALSHWHTYQDFTDPTQHTVIGKIIAGINRLHGQPKQQARALTPDELTRMVTHLIQQETLAATRDNALLQIGFFAALRRSELVAIKVEHLHWDEEGIEILIPSSKTDPEHQGQYCVIPYGEGTLCPIQALKKWLSLSNITTGYIFRRLYRFGRLDDKPLSAHSVNHIIKQCAADAGIQDAQTFSGHSLRRGLATSAARVGTPVHVIMRQGRWKQVNTVMEYIEAAARFNENAAANVLKASEINCKNSE